MNWEQLLNWVRENATTLIEKGESLSMYSDDFFLINNTWIIVDLP